MRPEILTVVNIMICGM